MFGTPLYTSPEQAAGGSKDVGPAADIYSLGVILYELWTGQVPFDGDTMTAIFVGHMTQEPRPPREWNPHLSPAHEEVLLKALEKKPEDRFGSADEFAAGLTALGAGRRVKEAPPPTKAQIHASKTVIVRKATPVPMRAPRFSRRQNRAFLRGAFVGAGLLAVGVVAGLVLRPASTTTAAVTPTTVVPVPAPIAAPPQPSAPRTVAITIRSNPTGAYVHRESAVLGMTPLTFELPETAAPFVAELRFPKYQTTRLDINVRRQTNYELKLTPESHSSKRKPAVVAPTVVEEPKSNYGMELMKPKY